MYLRWAWDRCPTAFPAGSSASRQAVLPGIRHGRLVVLAAHKRDDGPRRNPEYVGSGRALKRGTGSASERIKMKISSKDFRVSEGDKVDLKKRPTMVEP